MVTVAVDVFPAVSAAVTVIVLLPSASVMLATVQEALVEGNVALAVPDVELAPLDQLTDATFTLSAAVPASVVSGLVLVSSVVGDVMVTVGAVLS